MNTKLRSTLAAVTFLVLPTGIFLTGCVSTVRTREVSNASNVPIADGAVFQLLSTRIEVKGVYKIIKVTTTSKTGDADAVVLSETYLLRPSAPSDWTVAATPYADSRLTYSTDPVSDRKANIAFSSSEQDSNQVSVAEGGQIASLNYTPEDKSLDIIKNVIKTGSNVASLMAFPTGATTFAAAPGQVFETKETELGSVEVRTLREAEDVVNRKVSLNELVTQAAGSSRIQELLSTGQIDKDKFNIKKVKDTTYVPVLSITSANLCTSTQVKSAISSLMTSYSSNKKLPFVEGIVTRYAGDVRVELRIASPNAEESKNVAQLIFSGSARIVEAGGVQRIPLKSQTFGKSSDKITFSTTNGHVTKWGYGRDSGAERVSAAAVELTALSGTALGNVEKSRVAALAAEQKKVEDQFARKSAVLSAQAALVQAKLKLDEAESMLKAAESANPKDPVSIAKAKTAVAAAESDIKQKELEIKKAEALERLGG